MTPAVATGKEVTVASTARVEISFLIPVYNGLELTRACLRSLEETVDLSPHEVILINDASTDGTAEFLAALSAPYRVIHNAQRSGYAVGMNRGAALARGEMLCLLNNDLVFRPRWLPPMLRAFEKFPDAGVVGNVQFNPRTRRYDHMGMVFSPRGMPNHFGTDFLFVPFRGYTTWPAVTAACCLLKKSIFVKTGGFHEAYRNGFEDVDLCLSLGRMGFRHYVANASVVDHQVSASEGRREHEPENERIFDQRWPDRLVEHATPGERRRFAVNYLLRCLGNRSRYRAKKFGHALLTLLKCGH